MPTDPELCKPVYKTNTWTLDEGPVWIQFPFPLCQQSAAELEEFMLLFLRTMKRCATVIPVAKQNQSLSDLIPRND